MTGPNGIDVIREGHIPVRLFQRVMNEWEVDFSNCTMGKYPLIALPEEVASETLNPRQLRNHLLEFLDGA